MARREVLIDAYNVMFAHPRLGPLLRRDLQQAREQFLFLVSQRLPTDGTTVIVVFDATREPASPGTTGRAGRWTRHGVQVVFARESADAWIQRRIREHSDPGCLTIVTADRAILETARAHGAGSMRVAEFLQLAVRDRARMREIRSSEKPEHLSEREIEEWKRLFETPRDEE